jgi:FixJ family two-component response regulator
MSVRDLSARKKPAVVIIIEDDVALLQALRFMFVSEGYQALLCASGEELLALTLPQDRFCMILDQRLPGISGLDALRALRARGVVAPALLMTTDPGPDLVAAARLAQATIVEKPLVGDVLLSAVNATLGRPEDA